MGGFIDSLKPFWQKYKIEIILITLAFSVALISVIIFFSSQSSKHEEVPIVSAIKTTTPVPQENIIIDLSGSIENPDVYEVTLGARLKDVLILAGGLSSDADRRFFAQNFNLARILKDQEKIYIPSSEDIENQNLSNIPQGSQDFSQNVLGASDKININTASESELDTLPGVGEVTAGKIIQNRPYQSIDDLLNNKIVGKSVFEKIRDQITTD